jgi:hypothetical protein
VKIMKLPAPSQLSPCLQEWCWQVYAAACAGHAVKQQDIHAAAVAVVTQHSIIGPCIIVVMCTLERTVLTSVVADVILALSLMVSVKF